MTARLLVMLVVVAMVGVVWHDNPIGNAQPITIGTVQNLRDVTDRADRQLGQVTFSSAQPVTVGNFPSGFNILNFPTAPSTSAVSVRCVNAAGSAFESCAGAGGGGSTGQQTMGLSAPVVIASDQSAVPVTGTFWQATQPVSGPLTDTQLRASAITVAGPLSDTQLRATPVPVSGTFWQATQPVSGNVTSNPPTLTKGVQGSQGFTVQALKDAGRTAVALSFTTTAPTTADTVVTALVKNSGGVAAAGTQSITAAGGKTFRLTAVNAQIRTTTAALPWALVTLRMSNTTTCTAASSVVAYLAAGGTAAVIGNVGQFATQLPDGFELVAGGSFCISVSGNVTTNVLTFSAQGFEY